MLERRFQLLILDRPVNPVIQVVSRSSQPRGRRWKAVESLFYLSFEHLLHGNALRAASEIGRKRSAQPLASAVQPRFDSSHVCARRSTAISARAQFFILEQDQRFALQRRQTLNRPAHLRRTIPRRAVDGAVPLCAGTRGSSGNSSTVASCPCSTKMLHGEVSRRSIKIGAKLDARDGSKRSGCSDQTQEAIVRDIFGQRGRPSIR